MKKRQSYLLTASSEALDSLVRFIYPKVFREDFTQPGFAVLDFGKDLSSEALREIMLQLKKGFSQRLIAEKSMKLIYQWLGRFDQQETTKFHRDNASEQSILMLGYEPTQIKSKLFLADYLQFADKMKLSVEEYFAQYNPMYMDGEKLLEPFTAEVETFDEAAYKIVIVNNSNSLDAHKTKGLFHKAEMTTPDPNATRIVNSMMLSFTELDQADGFSLEQEQAFATTTKISKS